MANPEVSMTLDTAVAEVLGLLTGIDLQYAPELDRYQAITRALNRALRTNSLDNEWSYYSSVEEIGVAREGEQEVPLRASIRPRIINDDAVRLVQDGIPVEWAYFLPRDALHKYSARSDLRCSHTRSTLRFSRPFMEWENGLTIEVPVMREPKMFRLPPQPEDPNDPRVTVPDTVREQLVDFDYPDLIVARAAYFYAQTDPLMQPRVQTLEMDYKNYMYSLIERDARNTDSPYQNDFEVPIDNDIYGSRGHGLTHLHPHADERR